MAFRGPGWNEYDKTKERAATAEQELAAANQQIEDLKTLNKQMLTELQVGDNQSEVPVAHAQYVNGLGKYMVPVEGTLENHYRLIYDRSNELDFWPDQSPAFDGLVAQTFLDPAFGMSNHPRYFDYEPLRDNVSTVRNYVLQVVMNGVDQRDTGQMRAAERKLEQMGREIGVALERDSLFKRPGSASLDVSEVSEPGVGAAKIYALLTKKQASAGVMAPLKSLFGYDYTDWGLPPVERSPFNKENVAAFCMSDFGTSQSKERMDALEAAHVTQAARSARREADELLEQQQENAPAPEIAPANQAELSAAQRLSVLGATLAGSAFSLDRVRKLPEPVKDRSVELAREIIDKMRLSLGGASQDQWLELPAETAMAQGEAIGSISQVYADAYQTALAANPAIGDNPAVQQANDAMGKLAYLAKQQAGMKLVDEGRVDDAMMVMAELDTYPEQWKQTGDETVESLLAQLQTGLEMTHAATKQAQQMGLNAPQISSDIPEPAAITPPAAAPEQQAQPAPDLAALLAQAQAAQQQPHESQAPVVAERAPQFSPAQIQQMLSQGNLSVSEIDHIRQMQNEAATMQIAAPEKPGHAAAVGRGSPPAPALQQGNGGYRSAVQQQGSDTLLKR